MSKLQNISKSKFTRNVIIVATGTAMGQIIGVIFTPIITRLYGPEAYGLMGTFVSLSTMAASISALTYPNAIVLPKDDNDAKEIARLSVYVSIISGVLATFLILAGGKHLFIILGAQAIASFGLLIPLKMILTAWLRIAQQWFIRQKQFKALAKIDVLKNLIINGTNTAFGFFKPLAVVLIIVHTIGFGLHSLLLYLNWNKKKKYNDRPEKQKTLPLTHLAKKYYDFPLYRAPVVLIEDASSNLPVLMLSALFGPASAGFYVLGEKLLKAPSKLIGKSVADVFFTKITQAAHDGKNLRQLIIKATIGLGAAGFIPYATIVIFGPLIFEIVFGPEWKTAGDYARWISLISFFKFINRPSGVAIITLGLQKQLLIYELISTTIEVAALYAGFIIYKSDIIAVALFSSAYAISLISLTAYVIFISKNSIKQGRYSNI